MLIRLLLVPALLGLAAGQNLLVNGDFEQLLTTGWTATQGGSGYGVTDRQTHYHPDPDYEARDSLYAGAGWRRLAQRVNVSSVVLDVSFWAKFQIGGGSSTCWPVACVVVGYYNATNTLLGETRFYYHNSYCTWTSSSTLHLIEVTNPDWTRYSFNVAEELAQNLPGVNPAQVQRVEVALFDTTSGG
ncbi:hypothetical protein FJY69_04130 [candidate division WOR-3 bacterium]|nr:hypothetical protein [candidate division WOR-3 bacterium]